MSEIVLNCGFILQGAASCSACPGRALIWPSSALPAHLERYHGEGEKPRRGKGGKTWGQHNRKRMSSTGIEFKQGIHAA